MKDLVAKFGQQLEDAIEIGASASLQETDKSIQNVVITGLGGSGIGGKIVSQLVANECPTPITINNTYTLPAFVNENTLVIACSFSGNTEETLYALKEAENKGAEIAIISSGGEIIDIAKTKNYNHIVLPPEDSPRAMLSYSLTQQFFILQHYGLIGGDFTVDIENAIKTISSNTENIKNLAKATANIIHNKKTVIYAGDKYEGVAVRFRQQLNENAKVLCWHHVFPEMNHNELVGWAGGSDEFAVICFTNDDDHNRTKVRMNICKDVISKTAGSYTELESKGESIVERSLYLIHLGDWISIYLAELNSVDPVEVDIISHLKTELGKL